MKKLLLFLTSSLLAGFLGISNAATPNNYTITNTSQITYSIQNQNGNSPGISDIVSNASVAITTVANSPISIDLGTFSNVATSNNYNLNVGSCYYNGANGNLINLPLPKLVDNTQINLPAIINYQHTELLKSGEALIVKITDLNKNQNPNVRESIIVNITDTSNDNEVIVLTETDISSGIFMGYIQTKRGSLVNNDCSLTVKSNDSITVSYNSATQVNTIKASVLVDPLGKVFDTKTGQLINNALVTIINNNTGLPATVFGDDGISSYPSSMTTGSTVTDSSGTQYNHGTGEFRFPFIAPGSYKIIVTPPIGYSFPSKVSTATINASYPSYVILTPGSKGEVFNVTNSIVYLDIPIDSRDGTLVVTKTSNTNIIAIGDFLQYTVTIQNTDSNIANNINFEDTLPKGFKLKEESFALDNIKVKPIYDGKSIKYSIGNLQSNQTKTIKYVTQISTNSDIGMATNYAKAYGDGISSNLASSSVTVQDDLMMDKVIVAGTVYETEDCNKEKLKPLEGIKIQFETGDYVLSDQNGNWHIDRLKPMTHVAKIDKSTLPKDYSPVSCEKNSRFAQVADSQFVEGRPSSIERVDFYIKKKSLIERRLNAKELSLDELLGNNNLKVEVSNKSNEVITKEDNKSGTEALSLNEQFMSNNAVEDKILYPLENYNPQVPAVGFAVKTSFKNKIKLKVNGLNVNEFNFDGLRSDANKTINIYYWRGIPLQEGRNVIEAKIYDENDKEIKTLTKILHFTSNIVEARFVPSESKLIADGKSPIEIAVRFIDEFGNPAHKGLFGSYELNGNYSPFIDRTDGLPLDMINLRTQNQTQYMIKENGLAIIKLMPTSQAGELTLRFNLKNQQAIVRPWITAPNRDWILVGIAEGSLSGSKISKNMSQNPKGMEIVEDEKGRIAFYGKGTIKGDYLLTIAYDNKKDPNLNKGNTSNISQEIYSVYGDSTIAQRDAESMKKIYVRIEKDKFYAMFGNYQSNLSVTQLTRYNRNLTGFKTEYKDDKYNASGFIAKTSTLQQKEEIFVDGTTGPYRTSSPIVVNSESVMMVLRNKNQRDQIITTKSLTRYIDYNIDYDLGIITLKQPQDAFDVYLNRYSLIIDYNTLDSASDHTVMGGRIGYNINKNTEIGLSGVSDKGIQNNQEMVGVDLQYNDNNLNLKMELATSNRNEANTINKGQGYNIDAQYQKEWGSIRAYHKKVDANYGLSATLPNDIGIEKTGANLNYKISEKITFKGEFVSQKDLKTNATQQVTEVKVEDKFNDNFTGYVGMRNQTINNPISSNNNTNVSNSPTPSIVTKETEKNNSGLLGGEYKFNDIPLKINGQLNYTPDPNLANPQRLIVGAQYNINNDITALMDQQYSNFGKDVDGNSIVSNITRAGLRYKPWEGGQVQSYVGQDNGLNQNDFYQVGANQLFKYNNWSFNLGYNTQQWTKPIALTSIPAGTIITQDNFDAYTFIGTYRNEPLVYQVLAEDKIGDLDNKIHLSNNVYKKVNESWSYSFGQDYLEVNSKTTNNTKTVNENVRAGVSYRDKENITLGRLDWINTTQNNLETSKYVMNIHHNYKPNYSWEVFEHVGYKYVLTSFDNDEYTGSAYVVSAGVRKYLNEKWDLSVQGLYASTPSVKVSSKGYAAAIG